MGRPELLAAGGDPESEADRLLAVWRLGEIAGLCAPQERERLQAELGPDGGQAALGHWGAGVVVGSGGSSGGRRWCLQPLAHLEASARATARWLEEVGIDPAACLHLDPLPLQHVSGLMPLVRTRLWGAELRWLPPGLMREPEALAIAAPLPADRPVLLSLVPTQLERLLAHGAGAAWLRRCAVIWVGGAALPAALARRARLAGLRLAPCYGATETAAMVTALPPERFLAGGDGCGPPLADVRLRLAGAGDGTAAIEVCTDRLSPGFLQGGALKPLPQVGGWWRSGDGGSITAGELQVRGRLDGAISSGGETVFPEQVEQRLRELAASEGLALEALLLLPQEVPPWGQRLVALVRPASEAGKSLSRLAHLARRLPPSQRPIRWIACPDLAPDGRGKWERGRWRTWLERPVSEPARSGDAGTTCG